MAKKSEIRTAAREALAALAAAGEAADDAEGDRLVEVGLAKLSEAAGITPRGQRFRETARPASGGLLEAMGYDEVDQAMLREAGDVAGMQTGDATPVTAGLNAGRQDGSATKRITRELPVPGNVDELRRMIAEAGGNPPDDVRDHLTQHAHSMGHPDLVAHWHDGDVRESSSLREATSYALGEDGATNPRQRGGGLLERMNIDADELDF